MARHEKQQTFAVPATSGLYAPERCNLGIQPNVNTPNDTLLGVTALLQSGPASCVLELWLLQFNADPTADASYTNTGLNITAGSATWPLASWRGAQLRCKSGGTAGTATVTATAD